MKKLMATVLLSTMLLTQTANAGILILNGTIGNKFQGYKAVGWLTILFLGPAVLGIILDETENTIEAAGNVDTDLLSEGSKQLFLANAIETQVEGGVEFTTDAATARQIVELEGLQGVEAATMFSALTTSAL